MKTVVQVNICRNGSTGKIMEMLRGALAAEGDRGVCAYSRGKEPESPDYIKIGSRFDLYHHIAATRLFDRHGCSSVQATRQLVKKLDELRPEVIHLHNIHGYYLNMRILFNYLKNAGVPVVWTLHDCWAFTGHCGYFDYAQCGRWESGCYSCPQRGEYPKSFFMDRSRRSYEDKQKLFTDVPNLTLVCPSEWLAGLVKRSFLKEYPLKVIHNGIDLNVFSRRESEGMKQKLGIAPDKRVLLGVAADFGDKRKGFPVFEPIARSFPDCAVVLVGVREKQKQQIPGVICLSRTENVQELVELYSMADVFINPTLEDNFPTVNIEALACGTPVVSFDTGGCREQVKEGCGEVVPKGDERALARAIGAVLAKGKAAYTAKCRAVCEQCFGSGENYGEYLKLYQKLSENKD